ncbi:hypothetical protein [Naasia sp. SYSU D00948]|uniref:hypothetical protein n=1 Tax=Naasia sp. SYSU D00948 TaxID=2817379 RepID=UPI001B3068F3|nr:hypothetical protein [Naasia sp. SYSU D00948]
MLVYDRLETPAGLVVTHRSPLSIDELRSVQRDAERGRLVRLRRGVYVDADRWRAADPASRAVMQLHAYAASAPRPPTFCHESAALLLGLPLLTHDPAVIHVMAASDSGGRPSDGVRRHRPKLAFWPTVVQGLRVTPPAVTVVDLCSALPLRDAVVVADAALRSGVPREALEITAQSAARRGSRKIALAMALASPLSESVGESLSRVTIHELGLPAPVLQHEFRDRLGFIGRVDFWWPRDQVIGEFDGQVKYLGRHEERPEVTVWREKLREDRLGALGPRVVRWIWRDLQEPRRLFAALTAAGLGR